MIDRFDYNIHAFDPTPKSIEWLRTQDTNEKFKNYAFGLADFDGELSFHAPPNTDILITFPILLSPEAQTRSIFLLKNLQL